MMALPQTKMAMYNDKTVAKVFLNLREEIIPEEVQDKGQLHFLKWNRVSNHLVYGGDNSCLTLSKLSSELNDGEEAFETTVYRDGDEKVSITNSAWDEQYSRLATTDSTNRVTVWTVEERECIRTHTIPQCDQSKVIGLNWKGDKLLVANEDGNVKVFDYSVTGDPVFSRNLETKMTLCEWSPIDESMIFGTADARVMVYNPAAENSTMEEIPITHEILEYVVAIKYWRPRKHSTIDAEEVGCPADRPRFVIAFQRFYLQLMKSVDDPKPSVIDLKNLEIAAVEWSPNGAFLAVCGALINNPDRSSVHILTAYGEMYGSLHQLDLNMVDITWAPSSLKLAVASEKSLHTISICPDYRCGSIGDHFIYTYPGIEDQKIVVVNAEAQKIREKSFRNLENMAFGKTKLVVIVKERNLADILYTCKLYDGNFLSSRSTITRIRPKYACVNDEYLVTANEDRFCIWQFAEPFPTHHTLQKQIGGRTPIIKAVCMGGTFCLLAIARVGIYRVCLAKSDIEVDIVQYPMEDVRIRSMKLNCDCSRLAVLEGDRATNSLHLVIYTFQNEQKQLGKIQSWRDVDVLDYQFHGTSPNQISIRCKLDATVELRCYDGDEQVAGEPVDGVIVSYEGARVNLVDMDKVMMNPRSPSEDHFSFIDY